MDLPVTSPPLQHLFLKIKYNLRMERSLPKPRRESIQTLRNLSISFWPNVPNEPADIIPYFPYIPNVQQLSFSSIYTSDPSPISALGSLPQTIRSVVFTLSRILTAELSVIQQLQNMENLSFWSVTSDGGVPAGLGNSIQSRLGGKFLLNGGSPVNILKH